MKIFPRQRKMEIIYFTTVYTDFFCVCFYERRARERDIVNEHIVLDEPYEYPMTLENIYGWLPKTFVFFLLAIVCAMKCI